MQSNMWFSGSRELSVSRTATPAAAGVLSQDVTFSSLSLGTATSDRVIVVCVSARDGTTNFSLSSATIAGISANIVEQSDTSGTESISIIMYAAVPTGTTGDVVLHWSETITNNHAIVVYAVYGLLPSVVAQGNQSSGAASSRSVTVARSAPCVVFGIFSHQTTGTGINWTNLTEDVDGDVASNARASVAYDIFPTGGSDLTVTAARASGSGDVALTVVTFT